MFMNEVNTVGGYISNEMQAHIRDRKRFPYDLTTEDGKAKFEAYVKELNVKCPGVVAPYGEEFNFKTYYAEIGV